MTTQIDQLRVLRGQVQELEREAAQNIEEATDGYELAEHEGHQDAYRTVISLIDSIDSTLAILAAATPKASVQG